MDTDMDTAAYAPPDLSDGLPGRLWTLLLAVGLAAVGIRFVVFRDALARLPLLATAPEWLDMGTYDAWAREIAAGDWLSRARGAFYQNALYPYLLALVYVVAGAGNVVAGIVMNGLFGVAATLCAAGLGRRLFGWWAGLAAGLLTALSGAQLSVELLLLPDALLPAFFLGALWLIDAEFHRDDAEPPPVLWRWVLPGLLLGLATVGRGSNLLVAAALCCWLLLKGWRGRRRGLTAAAVVMGAAFWAVVAPVVLRNGLMFGEWTVSINGPPTLYLSNAPGATGFFSYPERYPEVRAMARASDEPGRVWLRELARDVRARPDAAAWVLVRKVQLLLNSFDAPDNGNYYFTRRYVPTLRHLTFGPLLIYVLGAVGLVLTWPRRRELVPVYVVALSLAATLLIFHVAGRFKLPILSLLGVLGAGGLRVLVHAARRRRWRIVSAACVIALAGAAVFWPRLPAGVDPQGLHPLLRKPDFINHSVALLEAGRVGDAAAMMRDGAHLFPAYPQFHERLAQLALDDGRFAEALEHVRAAISNGHGTRHLLRQRVEALAGLGRIEEAHRAVNALLRRYPDAAVSAAALRRLRDGSRAGDRAR